MDEPTLGLASTDWNNVWDPWAPWHRALRKDARLFPARGGGRRMRHPSLDPIVYPQVPDQTRNFLDHRLRQVRSVVTRTMTSSGVSKFPQPGDAVVIKEVFLARTLSTFTGLFRQFQEYLTTPLLPGDYIGWQPRDATPRNYFIDLLGVECGEPDEYLIEEMGNRRPYLMREQLTVSFKLVKGISFPSGVIVAVGK